MSLAPDRDLAINRSQENDRAAVAKTKRCEAKRSERRHNETNLFVPIFRSDRALCVFRCGEWSFDEGRFGARAKHDIRQRPDDDHRNAIQRQDPSRPLRRAA